MIIAVVITYYFIKDIVKFFNKDKLNEEQKGKIITVSIIFVLFMYFFGIDAIIDSHKELPKQEELIQRKSPVSISPYIYKPYKIDFNPKTYAEFKTRWDELNKLRIMAAQIVSYDKECDYVSISELSTKSTINSLKFFVDCENNKRVRLTEWQIREEINKLPKSHNKL
jgi:hypothetical protein